MIDSAMAGAYFLSNSLAQPPENASPSRDYPYTPSQTLHALDLFGCCCPRQATIS